MIGALYTLLFVSSAPPPAPAPQPDYSGWFVRRKKKVVKAAPELEPVIEQVQEAVEAPKPNTALEAERRARRKAREIERLAAEISQALIRRAADKARSDLAAVSAQYAALVQAESELTAMLIQAQAEWEQAKRDMEEADIVFVMSVLAA